MSTPTSPNGYFLADTNSLVYAYRAGGTRQLDTYFKFAKEQGRELAITETVAKEIRVGPLKEELGRYIADKDIKVLPTPKLERQLETGRVSGKNAGEASMLEVVAKEHTKGRSTRIWSEDKFFENPQQMRGAQGAEPVKTSQLLDQMRDGQFITDAEYRRTQARYQAAVPEFKPASASHSQRLATFDGPAPRVLDHLGVADASIAAKPGFQNFAKATGLAGGALMGYDAAATHTQYKALIAQGNQFGADALLHEYVGRTGGGLAAGFAAGAAYGAATGSWSGPGALVTGAVGGVIGAFGGEAIGRAYTQYQMNHQVGDDGNTYAHTHGHWEQSNWIHKNQPAAADQINTLEYKRTSAITELALARPQHLDPQNITLQEPRGQKSDYRLTKDGWVTEVTDQGPYGTAIPAGDFGAVQTHQERAGPALSKQLDQISAVRRDANAHYSENLAKAYMTDYVGRGFARNDRPVPESVTQLLRLPSEIHVKDPATGQAWERSPQGAFTRTEYLEMSGLEGEDYIPRTLTAKGEELARLDKEHQGHVQTNRQYGAALVEQKFQEMQQQQLKEQQAPQQTMTHGQQRHTPASRSVPVTHAAQDHVREELNGTRQQVPAPPQPATGHLTPQQIERITTHESRIVPTPGGMSFAEANKRRDEPERISPGSLQPVGKLDASHLDKGSQLHRMHRAQEQDLMRGLGIAQAQDRERFRNEPSPQRTPQPSVERTQERTPGHLLEEAPVQKQSVSSAPEVQAPAPIRGAQVVAPVAQDHVSPARPAAAAEAMHSQTTHTSMAAPVHSNPQGAAVAIAAAQAEAAAAQAELAEMREQVARMAEQRRQDGLERRDERDQRETRQQVVQSHDSRQHSDAAAHDKQISATAVVNASPLLRDFSDPSHPQNALYNTLKEGLPERTAPELLSHVTAACYKSGIKQPDDLGHVVGREGELHFLSNSLFSLGTTVDVTQPAPSVQQTMQEVQQFDQQRANDRAQSQAQTAAQANQQQGPMMGGP